MRETEHDKPTSVTDGLKTVQYARNPEGRVEIIEEDGWQPVNEVNGQAWREIEQRIDQARKKVASGRASCLYYYMVANQMNLLLLARYTHQSPLAVGLHLLPFFFKRIKTSRLQNYADLFHVTPEDLFQGNLNPAVSHSSSCHEPQRAA